MFDHLNCFFIQHLFQKCINIFKVVIKGFSVYTAVLDNFAYGDSGKTLLFHGSFQWFSKHFLCVVGCYAMFHSKSPFLCYWAYYTGNLRILQWTVWDICWSNMVLLSQIHSDRYILAVLSLRKFRYDVINQGRRYRMKKLKAKLQDIMKVTNWDGIRCIIKADPSIREIMTALKRQKEIDHYRWIHEMVPFSKFRYAEQIHGSITAAR